MIDYHGPFVAGVGAGHAAAHSYGQTFPAELAMSHPGQLDRALANP